MGNRSRTSLSVILAMAILVVGLVYGLFIRPNFYKITGGMITFDAIRVQSINTNLGETVSRMGDFLYVASEEGLTKYTIEGESVWNKSYHMNDPLFLIEAPYMAVVNLAGKNALIFNEEGLVGEVQTDHIIVAGCLNKAGFLSLTLENGKENLIYLYSAEGEEYVRRRTLYKKDGYPIDVAMSDDGAGMMTAHLDISQHMIVSNVTFLDFSSAGEAFEDRVLGHERLAGVMASKLVYFPEDRGVAVGDRVINFYETRPKPSLLNSIEVNAVIEYMTHTEEALIISYGDAIVPEGDSYANSIVVYSPEGIQQTQIHLEEQVTGLCADKETYYVIAASKVIAYQQGNKEWETTLYKPLSEIHRINGDRYLLVFEYDYEIVEIRDL